MVAAGVEDESRSRKISWRISKILEKDYRVLDQDYFSVETLLGAEYIL